MRDNERDIDHDRRRAAGSTRPRSSSPPTDRPRANSSVSTTVESKAAGCVYFAADDRAERHEVRGARRHRRRSGAQRRRHEQRRADLRARRPPPDRRRAARARRRRRSRRPHAPSSAAGGAPRSTGGNTSRPTASRTASHASATLRPEAVGAPSPTDDSCAATTATPRRSRVRCTPAVVVPKPSLRASARVDCPPPSLDLPTSPHESSHHMPDPTPARHVVSVRGRSRSCGAAQHRRRRCLGHGVRRGGHPVATPRVRRVGHGAGQPHDRTRAAVRRREVRRWR